MDARLAMSAAAAPEGGPTEPLLDVDDIQGNAIPGFMKPYQYVMALRIEDAVAAKRWLASNAGLFTTIAGLLPSRLAVRAERLARRVSAGATEAAAALDDAWLNIAFSYAGLAKLLAGTAHESDLAAFTDEAFVAGLVARSRLLGDPVDPAAEGNPANWVVGGPGNEPDILLVFGTDNPTTQESFVATRRASATGGGMTVLYEEAGQKLNPLGQEHFGFKDGVSQPGPRGRVAADPDTYLTPRSIDPSATPAAWFYGLPGQYLVWPGEFVFGLPAAAADPLLPGPAEVPGPGWSANGSYLVFRRLRQDVAGFRAFVAEQAAAVAKQPGFSQVTPDLLAAWIVGRWPSGAPVSRTPSGDVPGLGADPLANNHFGYAAASVRLPLTGGDQDAYPLAPSDPVGLTCPLPAHIRKVNTRDAGNDQGGRRASFNRRVLRVGLPFGPPLPDNEPDPVNGNRGLLFLCYQRSIVEQFEFLNTTWMGDPTNPRAPSGYDLLVGQNGQPGDQRVRSATLLNGEGGTATVTASVEYVIPTGGGYFFSPSISAITTVLAAS
ncbi:Dyp-type peroxidase [Jatrophihabitans sp.]|jgi:Dyp-type peroxidase family|uniref:Dyp-type peroxidase n=1 Tax=Jatrophihabitans sp. TaxID=1932789 RepID=UPI002EFA24E5